MSIEKEIITDDLAEVLESVLSQPPSSAGRRLRSERDLANLFQTDHFQVRRSLDKLVRKGLLVRRRGSGTYVRRVPPNKKPLSLLGVSVSPTSLLAPQKKDHGRTATPLSPMKHQQQLHLGLWADLLPEHAPGRQALIGGIIRQTEQAGHRISMHSSFGTGEKLASIPEMKRRLEDNPCDGYIVGTWQSDLILNALPQNHGPVVHFADSTRLINYKPTILADSYETVTRGIRLLAQQGYKRIGMIGLDIPEDPEEPTDPFRLLYERTMFDLGLNYNAVEFGQASIRDSMAATRRLLGRTDPPEAIYVHDDFVLNGVAEVLDIEGIVPGRDLGMITLCNVNSKLPTGVEWSRLEFDMEGLGELIVKTLLGLLQTAGLHVNSTSIHSTWRPGKTHLKNS